MAAGILDGITVIDLTSVVFGPYATQILGDLGADVIKVESPEGDVLRMADPARHRGMGAVFLNTNRNKRSVVLDLKQPAARDALLAIVREADIFAHSLRPQAIAKLGLTYAAMKESNPALIYASAWGFGAGGPYAQKPAYDDIIQAVSGIAHLAERRGDGAPAFAPTIMADKTGALTLAWALLAALFHRERTGEGQEVEVPMYESLVAYTLIEHLTGAGFRPQDGTMGYDRMLAPHRRPYRTADGYLTVLPYTARQWRAFFEVAGRPEMAEDPRVTDGPTRSRHIGALYGEIAAVMPQRTSAEWLRLLEAADIPAMPVNSLEDLLEDPQLAATNFFVDFEHPSEGAMRTTAVPARFSKAPGDPTRHPAPRLGEHTLEVLRAAGLGDGDIQGLVKAGAAGTPQDD